MVLLLIFSLLLSIHFVLSRVKEQTSWHTHKRTYACLHTHNHTHSHTHTHVNQECPPTEQSENVQAGNIRLQKRLKKKLAQKLKKPNKSWRNHDSLWKLKKILCCTKAEDFFFFSFVLIWTTLVVETANITTIIIIIDNFYIALFSALHKLAVFYKNTFSDSENQH